MTISIPAWAIPLAATIILWIGIITWPMPQRQGDYDFGPALVGVARLGGGVIATLVIWLAFFIWKAW